MPVVWIADKTPLPDCGNCDGHLSPTPVRQVFIYDSPSEVPREIKSGLVNLSVCPNCGYRAWLWPGMLTIDRARKRGVFCYMDDVPRPEDKLAECWEAAGQHLNQDEVEEIRKRTVWVYSYEHIYQVLCESDDVFSLDAVSGEQYRRRAKIVDLRERAGQWLKDTEEVGGVFMTDPEATPEFLTVLCDVIREYLDGPGEGRPLAEEGGPRQALEEFLAMIEARVQKSRPRPERRKPPVVHAETAVGPDDPLRAAAKPVSLSRSPEVTHALTKLVRTPPDPEAVGRAQCDERCLRMYLDAHHSLFGPDSDDFDLTLEGPLALMTREAPDVNVRYEEGVFGLAEYLSRFDDSDNCQVSMLCQIALTHSADRALFGAALAQYVARLWRKTGASYARFTANVLCAEFFTASGIRDHALMSLADACLSFDVEEERMLMMPQGSLRIYAVCWQRMGRYYSHFISGELSPMCSGIAANFFRMEGDFEGEARSRLDIFNFMITTRRRVRSEDVGQLLAEIVGRAAEADEDTHRRQTFRGMELECHYLLALAQLTERRGDPQVMMLDMGYQTKSKEEGGEPSELPPDFKPPIFAFSDEEPPEPESPPETQEEPAPGGRVLLIGISFNEQPGYVAGLQVWGVEWLRTMRQALKRAAEYGDEVWWYSVYYGVIEQTARIHPGVPIYFFRLMAAEAEAAGFGQMPEVLSSYLQVILAKCYVQQLKEGGSVYAYDPQLSLLLDAVEGGALAEPITDGEGGVQSLTGAGGVRGTHRRTPDSVTLVAELLEAGGRFSASAAQWRAYVDYFEGKLQETWAPGMRKVFVNNRVTGLYRLARTLLKSYRESNDYDSLVAAMNAIEAYKARSVLSDSDEPVAERPARGKATRFRTVDVEDLRGHLPENCFVMVFALMQETDINSGFWFSALISPREQKVLFPRFIEFDDVYKPATEVADAFVDARPNLVGKTLEDASEASRQFDPRLRESLERLGGVLFPEEVVGYLEGEGAERLIIVPESYLFDAPFPALRIGAGEKSRYLFELNRRAGTAISVSPNLTHFQRHESQHVVNIGPKQVVPLSVTLSLSPRWRGDLIPIYGVSGRLRQMFAGGGEDGAQGFELDFHRNGVQDFLDSLAKSRTALFFGHGEITEAEGSVLIANDGIISEHEVKAFSGGSRFKAQLLILCACSGVNANVKEGSVRKDIAGVHVALLRGGVRCVVGSVVPTFPVCGIILLQELLKSGPEGSACDQRLLNVYRAFASHPQISSPAFWGHLVGFGDPLFEIG